jgi:vacuolar-type H+-ATPase subunit E/Vma4
MSTKEVGEDAAAVENREEKAAEKKPRNGKRKTTEKEDKKKRKKSGKGARKALRHAVKKVVNENYDAIAETLMKGTKSGDLRSTDRLIELMEKKKKSGDDDFDHDGPSLAEQLAAEPSWDEMQEEKRIASERAKRVVAA